MKILGLSFDYHDSAAALLVDGEVVAAAQEERYSRIKHDAAFPRLAIDACLRQANLLVSDLDAVVYYERPLLKFDRIVYGSLRAGPRGLRYLADTLRSWLRKEKFLVRKRIARELRLPLDRVYDVKHHVSHAASAFFASGFDEATVITLDGVGEYECATVSVGRGTELNQIASVHYPHSIGLLYSAFTAFLGFEVNEGEYKVMGMAGFGEPRIVDKIRHLMVVEGLEIKIDQSYFDFFAPTETFATSRLIELLGEPREPESTFSYVPRTQDVSPDSDEAISRHYADIAASLQRLTEETILAFVRNAIERTSIKNVAMAGGVALNSLANGRIQRELGCNLYVQPAAGDAGGAVGAALQHYATTAKRRAKPMGSAYLGSAYSEGEIIAALADQNIKDFEVLEPAKLTDTVASLLAQGAVIGWFQDRFEWGPRALGSRSIIGNPMLPEMQLTINEKIKFREPFRPFAPAVLAERAHEFFETESVGDRLQPEHFMLSVCKVREEMRARLPAVTHVDGTARVQFVDKGHGNRFRELIESFEKITGTPVLLNTSFNRRGEPIVSSPTDALRTFFWSGLDYLVMSNVIVSKGVISL